MGFFSSPHFMLVSFSLFPFQAKRSFFLEKDLGKLMLLILSKEWWDVSPPPHSPIPLVPDLFREFLKSLLTNVVWFVQHNILRSE